ncbi:MAG: Flp family type IVb pilin [Pseudomonadales bacterium]
MYENIKKFLKNEEGLTAVEYAIAGALVVGGLVGAFTGLGEAVEERIEQLTGAVNGE